MTVVSEETLTAMESLSSMDELDSEPLLEEINQALDQLSSGKAPGKDGIPAEVIKCAKGTLWSAFHTCIDAMSAFFLGMMHPPGLEIYPAADKGVVSVTVRTLITTS